MGGHQALRSAEKLLMVLEKRKSLTFVGVALVSHPSPGVGGIPHPCGYKQCFFVHLKSKGKQK